MPKVWLITGCARGLGRSIAEAVLEAGDSLVASARTPAALQALVDRHGSRVAAIRHDVTDPAAAQAAVALAVSRFGRLDVLVNNAGYGHIAPIEQLGDAALRAEIDTNFMGVAYTSRAALPVMRRQRSGHIIQVSSVGGRMGSPGFGAYVAAKWAVGGFSEVLSKEVAALGIKVTVLEPGAMRTGFNSTAHEDPVELLPEYRQSVGAVKDMLAAHAGQESGDPARIAQLVLRLADHPNPPLHLLLGADAIEYVRPSEQQRADEQQRWDAVTRSSAVDAGAIPEFPR
jgi:NAD(P)-dependent dehydrogenase (short-subunit alcohol dehydrogenase family)